MTRKRYLKKLRAYSYACLMIARKYVDPEYNCPDHREPREQNKNRMQEVVHCYGSYSKAYQSIKETLLTDDPFYSEVSRIIKFK